MEELNTWNSDNDVCLIYKSFLGGLSLYRPSWSFSVHAIGNTAIEIENSGTICG